MVLFNNIHMDIISFIKSRRSVRSWTDQHVPDDLLKNILEAGRFSPSPLNSQPWHFIVIRTKETIKNLMSEAKHGPFLQSADVVIVVTIEKLARVDEWLSEHKQHIYSGACAMENMWLATSALNLGCCWVSVDDAATRKVLSIPDSQEILGSLAIGYPKTTPKEHMESDRKFLQEIVFYEKFGQDQR